MKNEPDDDPDLKSGTEARPVQKTTFQCKYEQTAVSTELEIKQCDISCKLKPSCFLGKTVIRTLQSGVREANGLQ